jgi:hypothetical protein
MQGDLPIEQPTKFRLAVNLKTAKPLGITIPESVFTPHLCTRAGGHHQREHNHDEVQRERRLRYSYWYLDE